jgi:hypothetical protein
MAMGKHAKRLSVNVISVVLLSLLTATGLFNWLVLPHGGGRREGF